MESCSFPFLIVFLSVFGAHFCPLCPPPPLWGLFGAFFGLRAAGVVSVLDELCGGGAPVGLVFLF